MAGVPLFICVLGGGFWSWGVFWFRPIAAWGGGCCVGGGGFVCLDLWLIFGFFRLGWIGISKRG